MLKKTSRLGRDETIKLVAHILHERGSDVPAKSSEIATHALDRAFKSHALSHSFDLSAFFDSSDLAQHISRSIRQHHDDCSHRKWVVVGNKSKGWSLGPAAQQLLRESHLDLQAPSDTQFTGLAGEYAVMSELLACDWNVAKLPHDNGVDILATKGLQLRTVQVKTRHVIQQGHCSFNVTRKSHDNHASIQHYYVLVLRRIDGTRYTNDFLVLNAHEIAEIQATSAVTSEDSNEWRIVVSTTPGEVHIGDRDYTHKLNRFRACFI